MKDIDITNANDFKEAGFKDCPKCGWSFDPELFDEHDCFTAGSGRSVTSDCGYGEKCGTEYPKCIYHAGLDKS